MTQAFGHSLADERSLALHREVARRLRAEPGLLEPARARVAEWRRTGATHEAYREAWQSILAQGLSAVLEVLEDPGERGQALRQASPFAYVIPPRERWRLLRQVSVGDEG
jgi:hypothetical protein